MQNTFFFYSSPTGNRAWRPNDPDSPSIFMGILARNLYHLGYHHDMDTISRSVIAEMSESEPAGQSYENLAVFCFKLADFKYKIGYEKLRISKIWNFQGDRRGTLQFDLFCTSTIFISSTFSVLRPKLYFDLNLTSTFLAKLYFDQNFTLTKTLLRPKLYFDLYVSTNSPDLTRGRVQRSKKASRSRKVEVRKLK